MENELFFPNAYVPDTFPVASIFFEAGEYLENAGRYPIEGWANLRIGRDGRVYADLGTVEEFLAGINTPDAAPDGYTDDPGEF